MSEVRYEGTGPLDTPQQSLGDQLPDGALHRKSGYVISLGELMLGRNPILRLQFTRLQLVQDLVFDLQISRLSHFFMQILLLHQFCET